MALTTTSYAILGLLDLRQWTAYELAGQATRSLAFAWPVSETQLYAEPKRLAREGLITITEAPAGPERRRQVLTITDEGRAALRAWLASEPAAPRLQLEILLRCLFAPSGSKGDLLRSIEATEDAVAEVYERGFTLLDSLADDNPFPERLHTNLLWMSLVHDLLVAVSTWAEDARIEVDRWADLRSGPGPEHAEARLKALARSARRRNEQRGRR